MAITNTGAAEQSLYQARKVTASIGSSRQPFAWAFRQPVCWQDDGAGSG